MRELQVIDVLQLQFQEDWAARGRIDGTRGLSRAASRTRVRLVTLVHGGSTATAPCGSVAAMHAVAPDTRGGASRGAG